jgi:uncharacterized protein YggE
MISRLAFLPVLVLLAQAVPAQASDPPPPSITVIGQGLVAAVPDMARVTAGVVTQGRNAKEANDANSAQMTAAINGLKAAGIAARDIATLNYGIQPLYTQQPGPRNEPPRISGYQVSNTLSIRVRDLARLGDILDRLVSLGINQVGGIELTLAEPQAKLDEARRAAVADARRKATLYAEALNVRLGRVLAVGENGQERPVPMVMRSQAMAADRVPIEAGEREMGATVSVTFEILQ